MSADQFRILLTPAYLAEGECDLSKAGKYISWWDP